VFGLNALRGLNFGPAQSRHQNQKQRKTLPSRRLRLCGEARI
jgi:hypothetical protein